jgi:hypothetical protein
VQCFKAKTWGGRGAGTPAPQLPLRRQNLVRANFAALIKERTKNQRIKEVKNSLIIIFLW